MMRTALLLASLALCALGADDTLIRELVEELGDKDAHVRKTARERIVDLGKPAMPYLVEALGNDSTVVRTEAALALGQMGTVAEEAAPALEKLLGDENLGLRRAAIEALERVAPTWNLVARIEAFLKAGEHDALLRLLANPRIEAADPAVLPVLVRLLEQHRADLRAAAARAIGRFKERAEFAIRPLIVAGGSQHWSVRFAVRDALVAIGSKSAEPLIEAMSRNGGSTQPWAASVFFGLGPKCVAAGILALNSENKQIRTAGAEALGAAGPAAALAMNRLMKALDDPAGMVRRAAAVALGSMGAHALDACPALITLANDPERRATLNAVWALGAIAQGVARPAPTGTQASGKKERDAIARGLAWLADHQDQDGRWDCDGFSKHDPRDDQCDGPGGKAFDLGVTGLALLAFLERGARQEDALLIRKGARYLVSSQTEIGFLGTRESAHYMYNHALATAGITAAYLRTRDPIYRNCAKKALRFIVDARNPDSAWRYAPQDGESDTSVTGWMVFALKLGSMAGLGIDERAFRGALSYLGTVTDATTGRVGYIEGM
ncbi:MAG: HEAT repeat domain-containing protein, partial [Planctomycetota bacterium]